MSANSVGDEIFQAVRQRAAARPEQRGWNQEASCTQHLGCWRCEGRW